MVGETPAGGASETGGPGFRTQSKGLIRWRCHGPRRLGYLGRRCHGRCRCRHGGDVGRGGSGSWHSHDGWHVRGNRTDTVADMFVVVGAVAATGGLVVASAVAGGGAFVVSGAVASSGALVVSGVVAATVTFVVTGVVAVAVSSAFDANGQAAPAMAINRQMRRVV